MQGIAMASLAYVVAMTVAIGGWLDPQAVRRPETQTQAENRVQRGVMDGREIFRFDTFEDEQLWTDVLLMHQVVQQQV